MLIQFLSCPFPLCFLCATRSGKILTGTGRMRSEFPAKSAMCRYKGMSFSAAAALQTAKDTPRIPLAPNLAVNIPRLERASIYVVFYTGWNTTQKGRSLPAAPKNCSTLDGLHAREYSVLLPPPQAPHCNVFPFYCAQNKWNYIYFLSHPSLASGCLSSLAPRLRSPDERNSY